MSFRTARIGDLLEKVETWNPVKQGHGEFDYIDLSAIDQNEKRITTSNRLSTSEAPSRARQLVRAGDVLVSTVRPNLNGVAKAVDEHDGMTASTGFCVLRPAVKKLDANYLFQWVKSSAFVDDMVRKATGASYPAVSDRIIKDSEIPLPHIDEQKQIAAILDKADQLRQKRRQAITLLDSLTQSIFQEMFGDGANNWESVALKDAVKRGTIVTYGIVQAGDEFVGGVPYIRTGDIQDGEISQVGLRHTDPKIAAKFARSRVEAGEIVMSIRATVGTTAIVPYELDGANLTQGTARIAPGADFTPEYFLYYLRSNPVQNWIQRQVKGATFREITLSRLRELSVTVPPLQLQIAFSNAILKLKAGRMKAVEAHMKADSLFASLQHRAFSGQL